jgi:hypothetical protein
MTETFDQWQFVIAAYVLGGGATLALRVELAGHAPRRSAP